MWKEAAHFVGARKSEGVGGREGRDRMRRSGVRDGGLGVHEVLTLFRGLVNLFSIALISSRSHCLLQSPMAGYQTFHTRAFILTPADIQSLT